MELVICLNKKDINTCVVGNSFQIQTGEVSISLSKDAAIELFDDLKDFVSKNAIDGTNYGLPQ